MRVYGWKWTLACGHSFWACYSKLHAIKTHKSSRCKILTIFKDNLAIRFSQTTYLFLLISRFHLAILFKETTGWIQIPLLFHGNQFFVCDQLLLLFYKTHEATWTLSKCPMPLMMTINEKENDSSTCKVSINRNREISLNLVMTCQLFKH